MKADPVGERETAGGSGGSIWEPRWTAHARGRWAERFPHLDPQLEWETAILNGRWGRCGAKVRAQIRHQCPKAAAEGRIARTFRGQYHRVSASGVVFVVAPGYVVVTVFPLG